MFRKPWGINHELSAMKFGYYPKTLDPIVYLVNSTCELKNTNCHYKYGWKKKVHKARACRVILRWFSIRFEFIMKCTRPVKTEPVA